MSDDSERLRGFLYEKINYTTANNGHNLFINLDIYKNKLVSRNIATMLTDKMISSSFQGSLFT